MALQSPTPPYLYLAGHVLAYYTSVLASGASNQMKACTWLIYSSIETHSSCRLLEVLGNERLKEKPRTLHSKNHNRLWP
jgi:hypothetical protein